MRPLLSIVVCTYNRADWLSKCLASLEPKCGDDCRIEVIVVDNNSTDETKQIVEAFSNRLRRFRYVFEATQGLSQARNRGIQEALGELVAYLDDDARVTVNWVNAVMAFFASHPDASAVGGPYSPFSTVAIPDWFPSEYGGWRLDGGTRLTTQGEWINGTNMVFRKQALVDVGRFDTSIGMMGNTVSYGEETNLQIRLRERKLKIYYCDAMLVEHAILPHKLSLRWLLKSSFANGYDAKQTFGRQDSAFAYLPTLAKALVRALIFLLTCKDVHFKTKLYHAGAPLFWHFGYFKRLAGH